MNFINQHSYLQILQINGLNILTVSLAAILHMKKILKSYTEMLTQLLSTDLQMSYHALTFSFDHFYF